MAARIMVLTTALILLLATSARIQAQTSGNLLETLRANGLEEFAQAAESAGLERLLQINGPFTIVAPSEWTAGSDRQALLYHIIPGRLTAAQLAQSSPRRTALGKNIDVTVSDGRVLLNGAASIVSGDLTATNGVIHEIDRRLTPPSGSDFGGQPAATPVPPPADDPALTVINVTSRVALPNAERLGVNFGQFNTNAAGFLQKNIIPNPGFEAAEYGMIFVTDGGASSTRVQARADFWNTADNNDETFNGQQPGFWQGARYEVLAGPAAGRSGVIERFTHEGDRYTFYLSGSGATPIGGSAIAVQQLLPGFQSNRWPYLGVDTDDRRPGSPGLQSLRLMPRAEGMPAYTRELDKATRDLDASAGKLIQIDRLWSLSIWAKAVDDSARLRIRLSREGGNVFFDETLAAPADWQQIERRFWGVDPLQAAPNGPVRLDLYAIGGDVLVDDVVVQRTNSYNDTAFTDRSLQAVRQLNPGVLRFWASQLGSTLDNMLSSGFAHRPTGYSPDRRVGLFFSYALPDLLQLAQTVDADPWIVIPPTFSSADWEDLVAYLAAPAGAHPLAARRAAAGQTAPWTTVFDEIHIEFGNETWGLASAVDPFRGATLGSGERTGQAADRAFGIMRASSYFDDGKFNLIIGGQARFAGRQQQIENNSERHDALAIAPYYGVLQRFETDAIRYNPLYAFALEAAQRGPVVQSAAIAQAAGKELAIYEINLHAIENPVPQEIRNDFLTSQGAAISLPLIMLELQQELAIRTQAVYELVEYSTAINNTDARLFGLVRDLEATNRRRPTFLAVQAANEAIAGDMLIVDHSGPSFVQQPVNRVMAATEVPYVQAYAFRDGSRYGLILFNLDIEAARDVIINAPAGGRAFVAQLAGDLHADNEESVAVTLRRQMLTDFGSGYRMRLPPHSLTVLKWYR